MTPGKNTRRDLDQLWQNMAQQTLGANIKSLKSTVGLPAGFEDRIEKALRLRNWLAHNYFWERAAHFNTTEGRAMMRQELDDAAAFLSALDDELTALGIKWRRALGITDEKVQEYVKRVLDNPDLDPYAA